MSSTNAKCKCIINVHSHICNMHDCICSLHDVYFHYTPANHKCSILADTFNKQVLLLDINCSPFLLLPRSSLAYLKEITRLVIIVPPVPILTILPIPMYKYVK